MKFKNCILINFVTDARTDGQAESNMPLQLFQSWGHKKMKGHIALGLSIRPSAGFCVRYKN